MKGGRRVSRCNHVCIKVAAIAQIFSNWSPVANSFQGSHGGLELSTASHPSRSPESFTRDCDVLFPISPFTFHSSHPPPNKSINPKATNLEDFIDAIHLALVFEAWLVLHEPHQGCKTGISINKKERC